MAAVARVEDHTTQFQTQNTGQGITLGGALGGQGSLFGGGRGPGRRASGTGQGSNIEPVRFFYRGPDRCWRRNGLGQRGQNALHPGGRRKRPHTYHVRLSQRIGPVELTSGKTQRKIERRGWVEDGGGQVAQQPLRGGAAPR